MGWEVTLSYPVFPYFYSYYKRKQLIPLMFFWKKSIQFYLKNPDFTYSEMFKNNENLKIETHLFYDCPQSFKLYDFVLIYTEYQIKEMGNKIDQSNVLFYFLHPLEIMQGNSDFFRSLIRNFKGRIISLSKFSNEYLLDVINKEAPVLPPALNPIFLKINDNISDEKEFDFLFNYIPSANKGFDICEEFLELVKTWYPEAKIGFFMSIVDSASKLKEQFPNANYYFNISNSQLKEMYSKYKFFIYPSRIEGFGIPPLEAITCGTIPIVMNVGGIGTYAEDNVNAIFFEEDCLELAVKKCVYLLKNPLELKKYQDACLEANLELFDPDTYAQRLLDLVA
ncbi:Glycosyl transferases group 1 [Methanolobus vulcani]|uniref:Glycosyl transferases group 1 n=2 Tax=Methanolobus vulcani TaxID=38026 RepID=A0A7Z7AYW5_9EURY|nr:Glycosyl transferases group 1 [Methanolobus vulcani]